MTKTRKFLAIITALLIVISVQTLAENRHGTISVTVGMNKPDSHNYQIIMICENFSCSIMDFKLPLWGPGYYRMMDFSDNVKNFSAMDEQGKKLAWQKTTKNTWRVASDNAQSVKIRYDVYSFKNFVGNSFLDSSHGYIVPTGVFMYMAGRLQHPITVTILPFQDWKKVSTGLDPEIGKINTFTAKNFDILYDCPILIGNQDTFSFQWNSKTYNIAIKEGNYKEKEKLMEILKRMVAAATNIIGDIPYKHYTFIMMGQGRGGIEHHNSMAAYSRIPSFDNPEKYKRWLSFITHEFFHLYNVKAIRPIALGPFDYEKENYTNMLWFSEGGTVYYQDIIMNRAGFISAGDVLKSLIRKIKSYENSPGNKKISVAQASFNTWTMPFFGGGDTISYYDKGAALCLLLDLKIRYESNNSKSLDDVLKKLYQKYYKLLKRGFTDKEFQIVCQEMAGCELTEFFKYINTTQEIDYDKYLGYAGLKIVVTQGENQQKEFNIERIANPGLLESKIFGSWLKK
jgi:predicted metalloprotease with PDZ domain